MLSEGDPAPDFTLPDQEGNPVTLSKLRGQTVVLYFYPRADTPGCTTQACGIRDHASDYDQIDATVIGISPDPVAAVRELKAQGDGDLMLYGYGRLAQALLEGGLVDELHFVVNPVVLGSGTPLFRPGKRVNLRLDSVAQRGNGAVTLTYLPA